MATAPYQQSFLSRHVPLAGWIRDYRWGEWLRLDVIAGVSVAALLIPESLGYAGVAGLPPEVGLYAAPLALLGYAILGRSTVLVVAASSSTAAVSASVIAELNAGGAADSAITLSAALALFTGVIFVVAGLVRLGWVANFMSKAVIAGFIIGLSINIIIGQLDDLLGIEVVGDSALQELWDAVSQIGDWDRAAMVVGAVSLALLLGLERFVKKLPAALTVVVLSVLFVRLVEPSDVALVGDIPQGLPAVGVPDFSTSDVAGLIAGGLAVALIGFSESYGAASLICPEVRRPTGQQPGVPGPGRVQHRRRAHKRDGGRRKPVEDGSERLRQGEEPDLERRAGGPGRAHAPVPGPIL